MWPMRMGDFCFILGPDRVQAAYRGHRRAMTLLQQGHLAETKFAENQQNSVVVNEMMHSFSHRKDAKRAKIYTIS
jgi:hypothetical protein